MYSYSHSVYQLDNINKMILTYELMLKNTNLVFNSYKNNDMSLFYQYLNNILDIIISLKSNISDDLDKDLKLKIYQFYDNIHMLVLDIYNVKNISDEKIEFIIKLLDIMKDSWESNINNESDDFNRLEIKI